MRNIKSNSFTKNFKHIVNAIVTDCEVCEAFDYNIPYEKYPKFEKAKALWDTGATNTCISKKLALKLDLQARGLAEMYHADGVAIVPTYFIGILLPNNLGFSSIEVLECDLTGTDILIGMDIISQGDFAISNFDGNTFFSFRIPSTQNISFVKIDSNEADTNNPKTQIGRNELCPCNSGKKHKNCCGKK